VGLCTHGETGQEAVVQFAVQPPLPVATSLYRCDKVFHWETLLPLYKTQVSYGLAIISGEEMRCFMVHGTELRKLSEASLAIHRQNRHKCGGQSQNRYLNQRQNQIAAFIKELAERLNAAFLDLDVSGKPRVQSLVLAGSGEIKDMVFAHPSLNAKLKAVIPAVIALGDTQDTPRALTLARSYFQGANLKMEQAVWAHLQELLSDPVASATVVYGPAELARAAADGLIKELTVHASVMSQFQDVVDASRAGGATIITLECLNEEAALFVQGYGGAMAVLYHGASAISSTSSASAAAASSTMT